MRIYTSHVNWTGTELDGISWCILEPYPGVDVRLSPNLCQPVWVEWWRRLLASGITTERWQEMPSPSPFRLLGGTVYLCLASVESHYDSRQRCLGYDGQDGVHRGCLDDDYRIHIPLSRDQMTVIYDGLMSWSMSSLQSSSDQALVGGTASMTTEHQEARPQIVDCVGDPSETVCADDVISYQEDQIAEVTEELILEAPLVIMTAHSDRISVRCQHLVIYPAEDGTFVMPTILGEETLVTIYLPDLPESCHHQLWKDGRLIPATGILSLPAVHIFAGDSLTSALLEVGVRTVVAPPYLEVPRGYRKTGRVLGNRRLEVWTALPRMKSARSAWR